MLVPALAALIGIVFSVAFYSFVIEPNWLRVCHRTVRVHGWGAGGERLRILHLSDLHVGRSNQRLIRFTKRAAAIPADVIAITGDFIESHDHAPELLDVLRPLLGDGRPVIGVLGNHDRYTYSDWRSQEGATAADSTPLIHILRNAGVELLIDSSFEWGTGIGRVAFAGVDIDSHNPAGIARALANLDLTSTVLLAHSPDIHRIAEHAGVSIVLTGHTHGGQIRVGPWFTPKTATKYRLKPPSGIHVKGRTVMHVSPGLGTTLLPFRFFARPEVTVIEILASESRESHSASEAAAR